MGVDEKWHSACHIAIARSTLLFYWSGGGRSSGYGGSPHSPVFQEKRAQTPLCTLPIAPTTALCLAWRSGLRIKLNLVLGKTDEVRRGFPSVPFADIGMGMSISGKWTPKSYGGVWGAGSPSGEFYPITLITSLLRGSDWDPAQEWGDRGEWAPWHTSRRRRLGRAGLRKGVTVDTGSLAVPGLLCEVCLLFFIL